MHSLYLVLVANCLASMNAAKLPSYIKPCSSTDPNLDRCVENVIRTYGPILIKGVPELDIPSMDPMYLGSINVTNHGLNITFKDLVLTGLSAFDLHSARLDMKKGKLNYNYTANITLDAHYVATGAILFLPIKGDGEAKIKLRNMNAVLKLDIKVVDDYWTIPNYKTTNKIEHANFQFPNLFGGNKELADLSHQFINDNWRDIINELAFPLVDLITDRCVDNMKKFFISVPAAQLLLDKSS